MGEKVTLSINDLIATGWDKFKSRPGLLIGALAIVWIFGFIPNMLNNVWEDNALMVVVTNLVFLIPQLILGMGLIRIVLDILQGRQTGIQDLFNQYPLFLRFLAGSILYNLIVFVGLILLIVPGIWLGIRLQFFSYLIIDKNMGPIEALKSSFEMTKGYAFDLFLLGIVAIILNILGALAVLLGLLVSVPVTMIALAEAYRRLSGSSVQSVPAA